MFRDEYQWSSFQLSLRYQLFLWFEAGARCRELVLPRLSSQWGPRRANAMASREGYPWAGSSSWVVSRWALCQRSCLACIPSQRGSYRQQCWVAKKIKLTSDFLKWKWGVYYKEIEVFLDSKTENKVHSSFMEAGEQKNRAASPSISFLVHVALSPLREKRVCSVLSPSSGSTSWTSTHRWQFQDLWVQISNSQ